ncbi:MAG: hypothetical protein AB1403_01575 [Candidatus Riflebacteria bacterium]
MKSVFLKLIAGLVLTVILVSSLIYYQAFYNREFSIDPNGYILQEFSHRKIIMLGDFEHGNPMPYQMLISFLQHWVDSLEKQTTDLTRLTLVLEKDVNQVKGMFDFIESGILENTFWGGDSTCIETMEFFIDLKRIIDRITDVNRARDQENQIHFEIFGPESIDMKPYYQMSLDDGFSYFLEKRDQDTTKNVIEYSQNHPEQKLLFFYGGAHLMRGKKNKSPHVKSGSGYFLGELLSNHFGLNKVLTVHMEPSVVFFNTTSNRKICDRLVPDQKIKKIYLRKSPIINFFNDLFGAPSFDAIIVLREKMTPQLPLQAVPSKTLVDQCIKRLERIYSFNPIGYLAKREADAIKRQLRVYTDEKLETARDWRNWFDNKGKAKSFFPEPIERGSKKYASTYLPSLIAILKFGNEEEKIRAKEILTKESGHTLDEPLDYLKWLRRQHFRVTY